MPQTETLIECAGCRRVGRESEAKAAGWRYRSDEGSILALLERHGSLAHEQIAALLRERPDAVRNTLAQLRDRGLIVALTVGDRPNAATSWSLTDSGRAALAALRHV